LHHNKIWCKMKRLITLSIIMSSAFGAYAQDVEGRVTLDEVTVKAAKVVNKADGMIIYPTDVQKRYSNNCYSILEKLSLANLRIDNINHTITAIDNRGEVQLRVDGVVVGKVEMLALDPKDIAKIDYINNPGVRYGDDIAYVINIITRRSESGYTIGTDLTSALTTLQGDEMVDGVPAEIGKDGIEKSGGHGREQKQDKGGLEEPDIPE